MQLGIECRSCQDANTGYGKAHWSVIEHRTRKHDIEVGNYTAQNLENMADLHGES